MLKSPNQRKIQPREFAVTLSKSKDKGLGFLVKERFTKPHVIITQIMQGGPAERNGLLRNGDVILSVNQTNLTKMSYIEALKCLREIPVNGEAVLLVRSKTNHLTQLNAQVTPDGMGKTVRINKPLPKIEKANDQQNGKVMEKKKEATERKKDETEMKIDDKPVNGNNTSSPNVANGDLKNKVLPPINKSKMMNGHTNGCPVEEKEQTKAANFALLKNWETEAIHRDTLHLKACPVNVCSKKQCKGSVMNPSHMVVDPRTFQRTMEETQNLAKDFIDQYFESTKRANSPAHISRLNEVKTSIAETGSYVHTEPELIYGAKTAWRNAPRCIGRIQWNKLHVYDCRHVTTTAEMFEAICKHLKYATNKGNIRSCITFFPPRLDVQTEFRVWNPQLIRYAGYEQSDGSIIGDPVNVEFTKICKRLGWKGKGTRFDVLPLVLQANGQDPDLYELPQDLVLEVIIRHPEYNWMEEMGLKWYAVPAVSGMLIDIGGVQYPGCPFNGWFMGTEIGRDLCDVARYNLLEPIATKMGLNTKNLSSLWKDRALLEVNVAIMYSFQADRVTIMDHHVATESFMKHFENELKLRNGCPGDWVWLVPPVSGSSTPIFHQEIINYILNPTCYYQPDPWKYYVWKHQDGKTAPRHKKIRFKDVARSVMLTSSMMSKAMSKRIKATILYATETGKSLMYAEQLKEIFNYAFNAQVISMADFDIWKLEYETLVLVVTSTFGNGDPPENGEAFAHELQKMTSDDWTPVRKKRFDSVVAKTPLDRRRSHYQRTLSDESLTTQQQGSLANVKFSVFGLGSTAYPNFCAFAHAVDTLLGEMGAERLLEIGEGDELAGQEESFRRWAKSVFSMSCETFCIEDDVNVDGATEAIGSTSYEKSKFRVTVLEETTETDYVKNLGMIHRKDVAKCKVSQRVDLHPRQPGRATILVKLDKESPDVLKFEPGDHIGIYPCNDPELVKELLKRIQDVPQETALVQLEILQEKKTAIGSFKHWIADKRLPVCSIWTAFSRYLDITTPPSPQLLNLFAETATNNEDKKRLEELAKGEEEYDEWKFHEMANVVEVLDAFSSIRVECSLLLSQLPLLQCRYYSISSSPQVHPDQIHCTVSVVSFHTQRGNGPLHRGVCSNYLDRIGPDEDVACFIRQANSFHLPSDSSTPCILVGPGTGIAPFRSFWQQRIHSIQKQEIDESLIVLLFGCRYPDDHIYKDEVEEAKRFGAVSHNFTAYSRLQGEPKTYVQNIMEDEISEFVFDTLCKNFGHLYVCGDVKMANDVGNTLKKIFVKEGEMKEEEAEKWIQEMKSDERYHEDIFGVTLRIKEVHENVRIEAKRKSIYN